METKMTKSQLIDGVVKTYRGRPGCGCGCRGTYSSNTATHRLRARDLAYAIRQGAKVEIGDALGSDVVVSHETDTRYLWVYFATREHAERFIERAGASVADQQVVALPTMSS